jgi:hypothetical protein
MKNGPVGTGYESGATGSGGVEAERKLDPNQMFWSGAVAKVPPPMGCVKYKTQPIVLSVQIPYLQDVDKRGPCISGIWLWKVQEMRGGCRDYEMMNRHFLKVCRRESHSKAQKWCSSCGWRWKSGQQSFCRSAGGRFESFMSSILRLISEWSGAPGSETDARSG